MKNDTEHEQPISSNKKAGQKSVIENILNRPAAYKVVLSSVVIGIIVISVFWLAVTPKENKADRTSLILPTDIKVNDEHETRRLEASTKKHEAIKDLLESISNRIDERASVQIKDSVSINEEFLALTESIKQINEMISELGVDHKDLSSMSSESTSRLSTVAEDIQVLKATKRKSATRKKPHSVKKLPFIIDAIDVWDNVGYVAISQSGHTSFLKVGEQQSGWTLVGIDHLKGQVSFQGAAGNVYSTSIKR